MLYDPKWEKKTKKAELLSLPRFIAWLESQPADHLYCYGDGGRCLLANYFHQNGRPKADFGGTFYRLTKNGPMHDLPQSFAEIAAEHPHTYGGALNRARKWR